MTYKEMLGRRSEILKRSIGSMIMKDNRNGLSQQESNFYNHMIKEWHQNESVLHSVKNRS